MTRHFQRILTIDLARLEGGEPSAVAPFASRRRGLAKVASFGGSALACAILADRCAERCADPLPFVIAVGEAVRDGLPTAARASVMARAPLTGLIGEGQVGGELGSRLATIADALVIEGRVAARSGVLVLDGRGRARICVFPGLIGASPRATARELEGALGPCAVLSIGAAGERGLPIASLASGGAHPSFVGRGGLGSALGTHGLKAIVIQAESVDGAGGARARELATRLACSPRLAERAAHGTFELFQAFGARGDGLALGGSAGLALLQSEQLLAEAHARAAAKKGCRGCPTPCGIVFEREGGARQQAHFSAAQALGTNLGLDSLDDALALLARCDELGIDAKEVGAGLALLASAAERGIVVGGPAFGDRPRFERWIDEIESGTGPAAELGKGAACLARSLGLEHELVLVRGQSAREENNLAALLGLVVGASGSDPMRSFPFLLEAAGDERLAGLVAPLVLPSGAADPQSPTGKGRLVWWHENLVAAVDASGFCAFSTAGLLADGLASLDELAQWILPRALREPDDEEGDEEWDEEWRALPPGERLLAAGANAVALARSLARSLDPERASEIPAFARERVDQPGMLEEYERARDVDALLGTPQVWTHGLAVFASERRSRVVVDVASAGPLSRGQVELRAVGALARALEGMRFLELELPASLHHVLASAAETREDLRAAFFKNGRIVPTVYRSGMRLQPDDRIAPGDILDLVLAIAGG